MQDLINESYIGVQIKRPNKRYIEKVVNIWVTRNLNGTIVQVQYLVTHDFCGQEVHDLVAAATVARYKIGIV